MSSIDNQYGFLFSLKNEYGIFKLSGEKEAYTGKYNDYELTEVHEHDVFYPRDLFKTIYYMSRAAIVNLESNDILAFKINGLVKAYRFMGYVKKGPDLFFQNFIELRDFITNEKTAIIDSVHNQTSVMGEKDGRIYPIKGLIHPKMELYAIGFEVYKSNELLMEVATSYVLYRLSAGSKKIEKVCENAGMLTHVLFEYHKRAQKNPSALLLATKAELQEVYDYIHLN